MHDDFEAPIESTERTIKVGNKSAVYRFREPSAGELETLFDVTSEDGSVSREKAKGLRFRIIAAVVTRNDGSKISVEQAGKMKNAVVNALHAAAMESIGFDADTEKEGNV